MLASLPFAATRSRISYFTANYDLTSEILTLAGPLTAQTCMFLFLLILMAMLTLNNNNASFFLLAVLTDEPISVRLEGWGLTQYQGSIPKRLMYASHTQVISLLNENLHILATRFM